MMEFGLGLCNCTFVFREQRDLVNKIGVSGIPKVFSIMPDFSICFPSTKDWSLANPSSLYV